jgi:putative Holliday junction resolvase
MHARGAGRILALDLGSRRIGLAVTDELGITAQGIDTLERSNKRRDLERLRTLISQYGVAEIVVGHPVHMSGDPSPRSRQAAEFAEQLRHEFKLPVHLWDERLTSTEANRLLRENQASLRQRKQAVDRMAATLILQSFLESRQAAPLGSGQQAEK